MYTQVLTVCLYSLVLNAVAHLPLESALQQQGRGDAADAVSDLAGHLRQQVQGWEPDVDGHFQSVSASTCVSLIQNARAALVLVPLHSLLDGEGQRLLERAVATLAQALEVIEARARLSSPETDLERRPQA